MASALLQQLDLDVEFDSWQPPSALIDKSTLRCVPRHGIGRACKVGKEQIVGLLLALQQFAGTSDAARTERLTTIAQALTAALRTVSRLDVQIIADAEGRGVPLVQVAIPAGMPAHEIADRLRRGSPSVRVDASRASNAVLLIVPTCLKMSDAEPIAAAFTVALSG